MEKEFAPYELAVKLTELGFNEPCLGGYDINNKWWYHPDSDVIIDVPLYQQAFDWFREKYELHSCILVLSKSKWAYVITNFTDYVDSDTQILKAFESYEEAREACLLKLIELCKKNTQLIQE